MKKIISLYQRNYDGDRLVRKVMSYLLSKETVDA